MVADMPHYDPSHERRHVQPPEPLLWFKCEFCPAQFLRVSKVVEHEFSEHEAQARKAARAQ